MTPEDTAADADLALALAIAAAEEQGAYGAYGGGYGEEAGVDDSDSDYDGRRTKKKGAAARGVLL